MIDLATPSQNTDSLIAVRAKEKLLIHAQIDARGDNIQAALPKIPEMNVPGGSGVIQQIQFDLLFEESSTIRKILPRHVAEAGCGIEDCQRTVRGMTQSPVVHPDNCERIKVFEGIAKGHATIGVLLCFGNHPLWGDQRQSTRGSTDDAHFDEGNDRDCLTGDRIFYGSKIFIERIAKRQRAKVSRLSAEGSRCII